MKTKSLLLSLAISVLPIQIYADSFHGYSKDSSAVSLLLGQPFSLRYETWSNWKRSFIYDIGFSGDQYIWGGMGYSIYIYNIQDQYKKHTSSNALLFYLSPGGFVAYNSGNSSATDSVQFGLRGLAGLHYALGSGRIQITGEFGPLLYLKGSRTGGLQAGVGLTYLFGNESGSNSSRTKSPVSKSVKSPTKGQDSEFEEDEFLDED